MTAENIIGKRIPSIDAQEKVTGRAVFGSDLVFPGMLYGSILRSRLAHARIVHIDIARAQRVPGVIDILTGADCPTERFGTFIFDESLLAREKVRFAGEEVALVVAIDRETAMEAVGLIEVKYEELLIVLNPEQAMLPGASLLHENHAQNIAYEVHLERGDVDAAFKSSYRIYEHEFATSMVHQSYLETTGAVADADSNGRITIWAGIQNPVGARWAYAQALGVTPDRIRIIQPYMGGGFGGKLEPKLPALCALAAFKLRRPVKIVQSRSEEFMAGSPRVPIKYRLKTGVSKEGRILAKEAYLIGDNGAYTRWASAILSTAAYRVDALYEIPNIRTTGYLVYTNKAPTSAFRGFGNGQTHFALESQIDMIAHDIGIDPAEIRTLNATRPGHTNVHGWFFRTAGLKECIQKATESSGWKEKLGQGRGKKGIGIGCCVHVSSNRAYKKEFDGAAAMVRLDESGIIEVYSGEADIGQGARTIFAQVAAEELGFPFEKVRIHAVDTSSVQFAWGTFGSRATYVGGNAVKKAAEDLRRKVLDYAGEKLNIDKSELNLRGSFIITKDGKQWGLAEIGFNYMCDHAGSYLTGFGHFIPDSAYPDENRYGNVSGAYPFGAHVAEVEVDTATGEIRVTNMVGVHDIGRTINPLLAEGQVEGGMAQGLGWALLENMVYDEQGRLKNPQFLDYQIPTMMDVPDSQVSFVETNEPSGPYGAKALGEPAIIPITPAIANAIYDAVGVRITDLPITPEKILRALKEKKGDKAKREEL